MTRKKVFKDDPSTATERLGVDLPKDLKRQFALTVMQQGKKMSTVVEELVRNWTERHKTKVSL